MVDSFVEQGHELASSGTVIMTVMSFPSWILGSWAKRSLEHTVTDKNNLSLQSISSTRIQIINTHTQ